MNQAHLGPKCFGPAVLEERFPDKFKLPQDVEKYDGRENPVTWLENYKITMSIQDVSSSILTHYMQLMMKNSACTWLFGFPAQSIHSWRDMKRVFIKNIEATYKHPENLADFKRCV